MNHEIAVLAGIDTDWHIELPEPLPAPELDMVSLFGNLIENAIAAAAKKYDGLLQVSSSGTEFFVDVVLKMIYISC